MVKTATKTRGFYASAYLDIEHILHQYLAIALEDGDPKAIQLVLRDIAKAQGMSMLAKQSGLNRQSLHKYFSAEGNPSFVTIMKITEALDLKITLAGSVN